MCFVEFFNVFFNKCPFSYHRWIQNVCPISWGLWWTGARSRSRDFCALSRCLHNAAIPHRREQSMAGDLKRDAEILIPSWDAGTGLAINVGICNPYPPEWTTHHPSCSQGSERSLFQEGNIIFREVPAGRLHFPPYGIEYLGCVRTVMSGHLD